MMRSKDGNMDYQPSSERSSNSSTILSDMSRYLREDPAECSVLSWSLWFEAAVEITCLSRVKFASSRFLILQLSYQVIQHAGGR